MRRKRLLLVWLPVGMGAIAISCGPAQISSAKGGSQNDGVPVVEVAPVVAQKLAVTMRLPGELQPYETVAIYPKVAGFVKWVGVDRGSQVKAGELMARLEAPELVAQRAEAQAKLQGAQSQLSAAEAKLAADEGTYQRLKAASATPGVVAGIELLVAQKAAEGARAQVESARAGVDAARQALQALAETADYLQVRAPFDGVITERNVHPGALVTPAGATGAAVPMVRISTLSRLRLVVPVPETYVADIPAGTVVPFTVAAYPGESFSGRIARIAHAVDVKTRTMAVELDVRNAAGRLSPGSYSQVLWPVRRPHPTLFVPASAVATTLERMFVVRIRDNKVEWVDVKTGATSGDSIEVFGTLQAGDEVAQRGTDELRPGTAVQPRSQ